jgi:hypothetical protein
MSEPRERAAEQLFRTVVPDPPVERLANLYEDIQQRLVTTRRIRMTVISTVTAVGAVTGIALFSSSSGRGRTAPVAPSPDVLPTCGVIPHSNGPLATKAKAVIDGPRSVVSGETFDGRVLITTNENNIVVDTSTAVTMLFVRNGTVVGRPQAGAAAAGLQLTVTRTAPGQVAARTIVAGCATDPIDPTDPERSRVPLPPGTYTMLAIVEDDTNGEINHADLVSAPFMLLVTATRQSSSAVPSRTPSSTSPMTTTGS